MSDPRLPDMSDRENLIIHIEGLQATLTKRNQKIELLEAKLAGESESAEMVRARERGFKAGWKSCANQLMDSTAKAATALGAVRRDAWKLYLESEREDFTNA